jgi:N-terminal domain of galactosyltransferase
VDYFIFHDVDVIPVANVDYGLRDYNVAWFMSAGSCKVLREACIKSNGYNPHFVGWGDQDTEFYYRLSCIDCVLKYWHKSEESRNAVFLNLEMPTLSASDALSWSKRYFEHDDHGPCFTPFDDEAPSARLQPYDKSRDFLFPECRQKNDETWTNVQRMPLAKKLEYFQAHCMNQVDVSVVSTKREWKSSCG